MKKNIEPREEKDIRGEGGRKNVRKLEGDGQGTEKGKIRRGGPFL